MQQPEIKFLNNPSLLQKAQELPTVGYLVKTADGLLALKIDDTYIHQLYPLLQDASISKPFYFGEQGIGAHISVIYPAEISNLNEAMLGQMHTFAIKEALIAKIINKNYYILTVNAPTLLAIRTQAGLAEKLVFKQYWIDFHITIGVKEC